MELLAEVQAESFSVEWRGDITTNADGSLSFDPALMWVIALGQDTNTCLGSHARGEPSLEMSLSAVCVFLDLVYTCNVLSKTWIGG